MDDADSNDADRTQAISLSLPKYAIHTDMTAAPPGPPGHVFFAP